MALIVGEVTNMRPEIAVKSEKFLIGGVPAGKKVHHTGSMPPTHGDTIDPPSLPVFCHDRQIKLSKARKSAPNANIGLLGSHL
jgi:hypothetical protein